MTSRRSTFTRRALIAAGIVAGGAVVVSGGSALLFFNATEPISTVGEVAFDTPLAIPPLLVPDPGEDGVKRFEFTLQTGESGILPGRRTATWGVNGPHLGPTLRMRRGDSVAMTVRNELPEETTIHWHGMHLPARMDGGPHQAIAPGETWEPEWEVDQPAATLWYHPHPHGKTAEHVYRGVAGLIIVDDDETDAQGLPREYGVDDIPLIVQDRNFDDDGQLDFDTGGLLDTFGGSPAFGIFGDTILVNGTKGPVFEATRRLTRFRILNGSNTRFYNLGFPDDRTFRLVATDNGLVPGERVELTRLRLGPGERAEIVVEMRAGDDIVLRSFEVDLDGQERQLRGNDTFDILRVHAGTLEDAADLPETLPGEGAPEPPNDATVRDIVLEGHNRINGEKMDMARIDEVVPADALEVWEVSSSSNPHTFHIHGATFHVLAVEGDAPPPTLRGPKDTVYVNDGHAVTLAVRFRDFVDAEMPYMYHCHLLRHEDNGMMGQFVVVEPGTEGSVDRTIETGHQH
jgi:FtsP/CotA-like multicopper oxidase with cupredoxin domain